MAGRLLGVVCVRRARFPVWSTEARGSAACSQRAQSSAPVMADPDPVQPPEVKWQLGGSCDGAVGGNETAFGAATCEWSRRQ